MTKPRKCKFKPMVLAENGTLKRKAGKFKYGIMFAIPTDICNLYMVEDYRGFVYYVHFADIRFLDTAEYFADKEKTDEN